MSKTILIPTDFTIASLFPLKQALSHDEEKVNVLLLYCCLPPDSITDLLFYSQERILAPLLNSNFKEACSILSNRYVSRIDMLKTEVFHGYNQSAFDRWIEAKQVEAAYIPNGYNYRLQRTGVDPLRFLLGGSLPVHRVMWDQKTALPEKDQIAELFLD